MSFLAYKTKLKLNNQHINLMRQCAGYNRWLWNWGLDLKQKAYAKALKRLARLQRDLSRKVFQSHSWYQTKLKVAQAHRKVDDKLGRI